LSRLSAGAAQPFAEPDKEEIPDNENGHADQVSSRGDGETAQGFHQKTAGGQTRQAGSQQTRTNPSVKRCEDDKRIENEVDPEPSGQKVPFVYQNGCRDGQNRPAVPEPNGFPLRHPPACLGRAACNALSPSVTPDTVLTIFTHTIDPFNLD
jgi:hypothetical protein